MNEKTTKCDNNKVILKEIKEKNFILSRTQAYLFDLEYDLDNANNELKFLKNNRKNFENELNKRLQNKNFEIEDYKKSLLDKNTEIEVYKKTLLDKNTEIEVYKKTLLDKNTEIDFLKREIIHDYNEIEEYKKFVLDKNSEIDFLKSQNDLNLSNLKDKNNSIKYYEETISNQQVEISYIKNRTFFNKFSLFSYLYLIIKSKPYELLLNLKLYKLLKKSKCFNIGFYLNNNKDVLESKWINYHSPELHYVIFGFDEKRKINKKLEDITSKKEILEYIKCE